MSFLWFGKRIAHIYHEQLFQPMKKKMTLSTDRNSASEGEYIEIRWACDAFDIYGLARYMEEGFGRRIAQVDERDFSLLLQAAAYCQLENKIKST